MSRIHVHTNSSSRFAFACRLVAYCAFHAAASDLSEYLSGAVSSESAPMLCTGAMCATSRSTSTYFFSSASKSSSDGLPAMNAAYSACMLPCHSQSCLEKPAR